MVDLYYYDNMVDLYYYDNNGQKQGPITGKQLRQLALQGEISLETKVETSDGRFVGTI